MRTAVILGAGRGTRLRSEVSDYPKGFLRLGERPIVEESILRLLDSGVARVVVVTGYHAEHYRALAARYPGRVETVHNERFAESGSMYSLYCARERVDGDFLLLESDLIYEPRALSTLLAHPAADAILISGPTGAGDEVWVETRDGALLAMSKNPADLSSDPSGELVGICKVSAELFRLMNAWSAERFERTLMVDYETDALVAAGAKRPIPCPRIDDLLWAEIDDPSHLARARERVYPAICQAGA